MEDPDMNPHSYAHLILDKDIKSIWYRIDSHFKNVDGKNGYLATKIKNTSMPITLY
jgi:hypothetical protein